MTSSLIGKNGTLRVRARVGLVSQEGMTELAQAIVGIGHDAFECTDWQSLATDAEQLPLDLIVCDEASLPTVPEGLAAPVVPVESHRELIGVGLGPMLTLAAELRECAARCDNLEHMVEGIRTGSAMLGNTPPMRRLQGAVSRAADCDATVLIEGPKGSGKSLAARMIHLKSRRAAQMLVVHDCAELSADGLLTAIQAGAHTTVILEDVDRLPTAAQAALVKHLKERSSSRQTQQVRLIATTAAHIPELVARGAFREDLFYRLHAFPVLVPGLHERTDDIAALSDFILDAGVAASGRNHQGFTPSARVLLESMSWPGNVAQLEATIRRSQVLAGGATIDREHLVSPNASSTQPAAPPSAVPSPNVSEEIELTEDAIRPFEEEEKFLLGRALQATKGNVRRAAQLLGIGRATLYRKIQQYRLRLH